MIENLLGILYYLHEGETTQETSEDNDQNKTTVNRLVVIKIRMGCHTHIVFRFVANHSSSVL